MSSKSSHLSIRDLAKAIQDKVQRLSEGRLSREEVETVTLECRDLYERLVVLRHKAYDEEVKGAESGGEKEESTPEPSVSFRIPAPEFREEPVALNQVSLIDAIEEITREQKNPLTEEKPAELIEEVQSSRAIPQEPLPNRESLNDKLSKSIPTQETLARKLEHTPITDLKRAITLNQRFQFSRELFKGNNQDYEVTIDRLNTVSRDEAMKTIESLRSRYSWSEESPVAQDFLELVERRHQA